MNLTSFLSRTIALRAMFASLALQAVAAILPAQTQSPPTLPPGAQVLQAPAGNVVSWHVLAFGAQIYRFDAATSTWTFVQPAAVLFDAGGFHLPVGTHSLGPIWQSLGGSSVIGQKIAGVTVDPTSIPWLLLGAVSTTGPGVLEPTTYVQRTNTSGGLAPARTGLPGEIAYVPYFAEYWFYRAQ